MRAVFDARWGSYISLDRCCAHFFSVRTSCQMTTKFESSTRNLTHARTQVWRDTKYTTFHKYSEWQWQVVIVEGRNWFDMYGCNEIDVHGDAQSSCITASTNGIFFRLLSLLCESSFHRYSHAWVKAQLRSDERYIIRTTHFVIRTFQNGFVSLYWRRRG